MITSPNHAGQVAQAKADEANPPSEQLLAIRKAVIAERTAANIAREVHSHYLSVVWRNSKALTTEDDRKAQDEAREAFLSAYRALGAAQYATDVATGVEVR